MRWNRMGPLAWLFFCGLLHFQADGEFLGTNGVGLFEFIQAVRSLSGVFGPLPMCADPLTYVQVHVCGCKL